MDDRPARGADPRKERPRLTPAEVTAETGGRLEAILLADLAATAGLSRTHFAAQFRLATWRCWAWKELGSLGQMPD